MESNTNPAPTKSYTLHRTIKLPIDGVQFSNTECGASITSDNLEDAKKELQEIMDEFLTGNKLVFKANVDAQVKQAYNKGLAEGKLQAPKVVEQFEGTSPAPSITEEDRKNLARYDRLKKLINHVYSSLSPGAKAEMTTLKEAFEKTNPPIQ